MSARRTPLGGPFPRREYQPAPDGRQAKGKSERLHGFWQLRLPACFASEHIHHPATANQYLPALRQHHHQREVHRQLPMTPAKPGTRPTRKTAPSSAPPPTALGGLWSGACAPTSASVPSDVSPSAASPSALVQPLVLRPSSATTPLATTRSRLPIPTACSSPESSSPTSPNPEPTSTPHRLPAPLLRRCRPTLRPLSSPLHKFANVFSEC